MKAAGVGHLICSSVGSANRATKIPHFDSKFLVEQHIATLGVPYTISAPVAFMDNVVALGRVANQHLAGVLPPAAVRRLGAAEGLEPPQTAGDIGLIAALGRPAQPLTPPVTAPWTMYFWAKENSRSVGIIISTQPAIRFPQSVLYCCTNI